ncbi:radical SAM/SPASM domain-containing protein [Patescibacteria group bacterium]
MIPRSKNPNREICQNKKLHESLWKLKHFFAVSYYKFNKKADPIFEYVEIETNPICNRKCPFCPVYQDKTPKKIMSDELFNKIINELKELHFKGEISLVSYGEPLLDERLPEFIKRIKAELGSKVIINTNADFLTVKKFRELVSAGIDTIAVSQHDKEPSQAIKNLFSEVSFTEQKHLIYSVVNEDSPLVNRGGSVEVKTSRTLFACPVKNIYIRADGNVRFCCNDYYCEVKVGDVNQSKLIDVWNNPFYKKIRNEFRRDVFNLKICKRCKGINSSK